MYWLFRLHNIAPAQFFKMGEREKKVMKAFIHQELEDIRKEQEDGK